MKIGTRPTPGELRKGAVLRPLSQGQLERVSRRAQRLALCHGELLFQQGEPAERFYLVQKGHIKLFLLSKDGREKVVEIVPPNGSFAEALMFLDQRIYPIGASAIGVVELISIDSDDFVALLRESVETCFLIMGDLSRRLNALITEIDNLCLRSALGRVAGYLLRLAEAHGDVFDLKIPKLAIASQLSVQPETFSRLVRDLRDRGIIRVSARRIQVLDLSGLRDAAESEDAW